MLVTEPVKLQKGHKSINKLYYKNSQYQALCGIQTAMLVIIHKTSYLPKVLEVFTREIEICE